MAAKASSYSICSKFTQIDSLNWINAYWTFLVQSLNKHHCSMWKHFVFCIPSFSTNSQTFQVKALDLDLWWGHLLINLWNSTAPAELRHRRRNEWIHRLEENKWLLMGRVGHFFVPPEHFTFLFILTSLKPDVEHAVIAGKFLTICSKKVKKK